VTAAAEVGVFGGSGFYKLLDEVERVDVDTPFGPPSDSIAIGRLGETRVAFLPRHGAGHHLPPAAINYRANLWAMKELGVTRVIGPTAAGSLQPYVRPGDFVVCDQFVNRTWGRADTYYGEGPRVAHVAAADPYCPVMRELAVQLAREQGVTVHDRGTVVVIQGPRFSTRAESHWYSSMGWQVINMTQYPEAILARELELCYANVALITDYDAGLEGHPDVQPVSVAEVEKVFAGNNDRVRELILGMIPRLPGGRDCPCPSAMQGAFIGGG
jgi:5'-methylthioadenosine phosphorylase